MRLHGRGSSAAVGGIALPMAVHAGSAIPRQAAIDYATRATRPAMTTGVQAPEGASPWRDAFRNLLFSQAASGRLPAGF
jgi:hypothetical protein